MMTSLPARAANEESSIRIPSVTRWVYIFSHREFELTEAVRKRDTKAVSGLLADNFEMRTGVTPVEPIPRADWIKQSLAEPQFQSKLEQMAVHAYDHIAIVSYLWVVTPDKQQGAKREVFVVDTWQEQGGQWKLAVRYAAPGGETGMAIPAGKPPAPVFEKKE